MSQLPHPPVNVPEGATLARYVDTLWGDKTRLVPKQIVAVLTTSTRVLKNNPRRMSALIVNRGTGQVDLDWAASLVLGDGVPLAASGGSLTLTAFEDGELVSAELFAISAAIGNSLSVYEVETL